MNPKDGIRYCGHFMINAEGYNVYKNYKRDHRLPLAWRSFTFAFVQRKDYIASKMKKKSTREVGFHLSLKLKKRCIVGKKRATEVS